MQVYGPNHYVPVLKLKQNEKRAISDLPEHVLRSVTPLWEIVEKQEDKSVTRHLKTSFNGFDAAVRNLRSVYLDCREVEDLEHNMTERCLALARATGARIIPVTGLHRPEGQAAAVRSGRNGIALRVLRREFEREDLTTSIPRFMSQNQFKPTSTDLIVDLGSVDTMITEGVVELARQFLQAIPQADWRNLILLSTAFPRSMGAVARNSHLLVERADWSAWQAIRAEWRGRGFRCPTFGDCAIQHPEGVEGYDPRIMPMSPSIRYATLENWLLIKGVSSRAIPMADQYPRLAKKLVMGELSGHFRGSNHCLGCVGAEATSRGRGRFGSPGAWRRLGTAHHIRTVIEQLSALPS